MCYNCCHSKQKHETKVISDASGNKSNEQSKYSLVYLLIVCIMVLLTAYYIFIIVWREVAGSAAGSRKNALAKYSAKQGAGSGGIRENTGRLSKMELAAGITRRAPRVSVTSNFF